uniref:Aldehyde oxidase 3 n=1 Tax=Sphaerodactylus townsendi TaxID=933632 RepID=A0ACB8G087_9SAUR
MISRYEPVAKKIIHYSANACLLPLYSLYGCAVITVEGIGSTKTRIHPVQERIAKSHGSQCGFCTPGMVMSIYALLRNEIEPSEEQIAEALSGNLCRCTGYRPIIDGSKTFCKESMCCQDKENRGCCLDEEDGLPLLPNKEKKICTTLFSSEEFQPLDPTQELIFPPELMRMAECQTPQTLIFHTGKETMWDLSCKLSRELLELKAKYPLATLFHTWEYSWCGTRYIWQI